MSQLNKENLRKFNDALEELAQSIAAINPAREKCHAPKLADAATNQQRGDALKEALSTLSDISPEAALGEDEVAEFIGFFSQLYGGGTPYRHLYSDVCSVMYDALSTNPDHLDDGVPYQARNLANNMELIHRAVDANNVPDQVKRSVHKLYDHIELENTRMTYMARQNKAQIAGVKKLHDEVEGVGAKAEEIQKRMHDDVDEVKANIAETQDNLQRNYVTILGIFAAIVIAFATGSAFSSSVIQAMASVSVYRLAFVMLVLGLFLFDLVMALFFFICRVSKFKEGKHLPTLVKAVNIILVIGIVATLAARFFHFFG